MGSQTNTGSRIPVKMVVSVETIEAAEVKWRERRRYLSLPVHSPQSRNLSRLAYHNGAIAAIANIKKHARPEIVECPPA